jgi:Glycosyltransferase family 87
VPGTEARRLTRVAGALAGASTVLILVTAALGPSAAEPPLGPRHGLRGLLPAYSLAVHPSSALVTVLLDLAYVLGGLGVGLGLLAVRAGHRLDGRRVWLVGAVFAVAAILVPPIGSADHVNYAAYGRIAAQGGDPYVVEPVQWHDGHDPVTSAVEAPWTRTPSIYGPVATAVQTVTSLAGGDSLRATVWFWQLICAAAWLLIGRILLRTTAVGEGAGSPRQSRAMWLWLLNPVLYGVVLVGAHIDLLATAFALVALVLAARQPFWAGVALGGAVGTKLTLLLAVPALLWALRKMAARQLGRHVMIGTAGAAAVLVPAHLWAGSHVFDQLERSRSYVSLATPWRPVVEWLTGPFSHAAVRHGVRVLTPVVIIAVALALARIVRATPNLRPAASTDLEQLDEQVVADGAVALVVLLAAYVLAAPYSLPWYDAAAWAPLALVAGGAMDALLLVRLTAYAAAYVPGRVIGMSPSVHDVTLGYRRDVTPYVGWLVLAAVAALALRRRSPEP